MNFSDHNTIKYEIEVEQIKLPPTRKWDKMDREAFRVTLNSSNIRIMSNMTGSRLEKCLTQWYTQINDALDKHCPKQRNKPQDLNNPWWTGKLPQMRKALKVAKKKHILNPSNPDYKGKLKKYKKECLTAKTKEY